MQGSCCPEGSWPALKVDYNPIGEKLQIAGTSVYHTGSGDKILIIISDIFGATSGRHLNVADTFATFGYNVYLPELLIKPFQGDGSELPPIFECIKQQNWEEMEARFKGLVEYLADKGHKNFYAAGFCWGVWAGFKYAVKYEGFIAFVGMHPSLGICGLFGQNQAELVKSIKCPAYLMPAGNDPPNVKKGGELVELLKERFGEEKTGVTEFPDMVHGWVVRSNVKEEKNYKDVQLALKLAKEYFSKF